MIPYLLLIGGLALLIGGGEAIVKGAVKCALKFRISKLVVGMTIVSFGTSAPELVVSLVAAFKDTPDIATGNIIGSNIANLGLVLGLTAVVFPITVSRNSIRFDWPFMMGISILFYFLILNGSLGRIEGTVLIIMVLIFTWFLIWKSRSDNKKSPVDIEEDEEKAAEEPLWRSVLLVIAGVIGLSVGSELLVEGAVDIAEQYGVSELVISATIVAFGTSAPELITSLTAAFRKHADISVGNLIGSNLYNIALVLGVTGLVEPISVNPLILDYDIFWMLGISFIIFPFMLFGKKITRVEGVILFLGYAAYILSTTFFA